MGVLFSCSVSTLKPEDLEQWVVVPGNKVGLCRGSGLGSAEDLAFVGSARCLLCWPENPIGRLVQIECRLFRWLAGSMLPDPIAGVLCFRRCWVALGGHYQNGNCGVVVAQRPREGGVGGWGVTVSPLGSEGMVICWCGSLGLKAASRLNMGKRRGWAHFVGVVFGFALFMFFLFMSLD
ncbi:hypothetical protein ACLB2K_004837 [Fragaria x ananassa]